MICVVVDNNEKSLALLTEAITSVLPTCQVQSFTDPLLSAKYICNHAVDIAFLVDTMRPVNGFRLLQVLRKNVPTLAIAMLSSSEANRADAIRAGVDAFAVKPITTSILKDMLEELGILEIRQTLREK